MKEQAVVNNPIQQPNIPTPPEPKQHSFLTSKIFLTVLVIVVLFTLVYAGIYLYLGSQLDQISKSSPTSLPSETSVKEEDPTANWKTYRNDKFRFEVKYPGNWAISAQNTDIGIWEILVLIGESEEGMVQLGVFKDVTRIDEIDFGDIFQPSTIMYDELDDVMVGQKQYAAKKLEYRNQGLEVDLVAYLLERNGKVYELQYNSRLGDSVLFDQILSTFKFIDQEQTVCTQDAKMCLDGSYVSRQPPTCEFTTCP